MPQVEQEWFKKLAKEARWRAGLYLAAVFLGLVAFTLGLIGLQIAVSAAFGGLVAGLVAICVGLSIMVAILARAWHGGSR